MVPKIQNQLYYDEIKSRVTMFIDHGIWDGIDSNMFTSWLNNFNTPEEKQFAASILDQLIYRSKAQLISMLYDLFTKNLQNTFRTSSSELYDSQSNPLIHLKERKNPKFRILAAVTSDSPPSKSGYLITSLLVRELGIHQNWTISTNNIENEIKKGIKNFVIVDDIICTGSTIVEVLDYLNIRQYSNVNFFIAVCTAHETGLKYIHEKYPIVNITYSELLTAKSSFLSMNFKDTPYSDLEDFKSKYRNYITKHKFKNKNYGYNDMALLYAFYFGTPNASLPILYYKSETFSPLLKKRL